MWVLLVQKLLLDFETQMEQISYYIKFFTFARYKLVESNDTNVIISLPVDVVGTYAEPEAWSTVVGNDTVAEPVVDTKILTVCPGLIFDGFINVLDPDTNCRVKKLPLFKSNDAVFEEIDNAVKFPFTEPVIVWAPLNVFEPVIANDPVAIGVLGAYEADNAVVANDADSANEAVPFNEPVIPPVNTHDPLYWALIFPLPSANIILLDNILLFVQ